MAATATFVPSRPTGTPEHHRCPHIPTCPGAYDPDRDAARPLAAHPEQGWTLLCNGVIVFDDTGELLPDGHAIAPHRPTDAAGTVPAQGRAR